MGSRSAPTVSRARVGKAVVIVGAGIVLATAVALHTGVAAFLWAHRWVQSVLLGVPSLALLTAGLRHSSEANRLSSERNRLSSELDHERNRQLQGIRAGLADPVAEDNYNRLRRRLGQAVAVTEGKNSWGADMRIADVSEARTVTLFRPRAPGSQAWSQQVRCGDLAITEGQGGRLSLDVLRPRGQPANLGEITDWAERNRQGGAPDYPRGPVACRAVYTKQGTSDVRQLVIYAPSDGSGLYLLQTDDGAQFHGNGKDVSKRFLGVQVDLLADGFQRTEFGLASGGGLRAMSAQRGGHGDGRSGRPLRAL